MYQTTPLGKRKYNAQNRRDDKEFISRVHKESL